MKREARLANPAAAAVNLFIAVAGNSRIRVLTQLTDSGGAHAPLLEGISDLLPF